MQGRSVELADEILSVLAGEEFHTAITALRLTKIMLPSGTTPSGQPQHENHEALEVSV
jgi:hypothetical protein